jgi:hypothetical protein
MSGTQNVVPHLVTFDTAAHAANKLPLLIQLSPADTLLSTVASINGKVTGQTTLYTVPAGKSCIVTKMIVHLTSASNVTGVATITAGVTSAWTSVLASTALTGLDVTGECFVLSASNPSIVTAAAGTIKLDVASAATTTGGGDTYTFRVLLFGILY